MTRADQPPGKGSGDTKDYLEFLKASGVPTTQHAGIGWYQYNGFLRPAYLPHATPAISNDAAQIARARLGAYFGRWESDFDQETPSDWWHVIRKGTYDLSALSSNNRSKLRRGKKRLTARRIEPELLSRYGLDICKAAAQRYGHDSFVPAQDVFQMRLEAAKSHTDTAQYFGVFKGDDLVSFSEHVVQDAAVCMEMIWHHPDHMRDYSGYVLVDAVLEHYLNEQGFSYVSDGARSLFHRTNIHDFLIGTFGFERAYAKLHLAYHPLMRLGMRPLSASHMAISALQKRWTVPVLDKIDGVLTQHRIAHSPQNHPIENK